MINSKEKRYRIVLELTLGGLLDEEELIQWLKDEVLLGHDDKLTSIEEIKEGT